MWLFELDTGGSGGLCCLQLGGRRISHLEKADVALFFFFWCSRCVSALSLFPFPPPRSLTPPLFCFVLFCRASATLRGVWTFWSLRKVATFFDHGGHRGSRLESAAPVSFTLSSSEQRVRHLKERHAAYCWSGKKWPEESLLRQMKLLTVQMFRPMLTKVEARCILETFISCFLIVVTAVCSFSAHL